MTIVQENPVEVEQQVANTSHPLDITEPVSVLAKLSEQKEKEERKTERIQLLITPSLKKKVASLAASNGLSKNEVWIAAMEEFIKNEV